MAGAPRKISDEELLERVREVAIPVASSGEISEDLDVIQKTVEKRLDELHERGLVERKKVGRAWAWWITEEGESYLSNEADSGDSNQDVR